MTVAEVRSSLNTNEEKGSHLTLIPRATRAYEQELYLQDLSNFQSFLFDLRHILKLDTQSPAIFSDQRSGPIQFDLDGIRFYRNEKKEWAADVSGVQFRPGERAANNRPTLFVYNTTGAMVKDSSIGSIGSLSDLGKLLATNRIKVRTV